MARPRSFDEAVVLDKAMRQFWSKGFEATSLADLVAVTGLAKGSLYQAFGDKRQLYLRTLRNYLDEGRVNMAQNLGSASSGHRGIADWLARMGERASARPRTGCFGVNAAVELGAHDVEVRGIMADHDRHRKVILAEALSRGVAEGDFRADLDPEAGAGFLILFSHGIMSMGRASLEKKEVEALIEITLRALE
ncbi:MAG: TetR/AcrR family transcriptional regulator [Myxococcota bacterium]